MKPGTFQQIVIEILIRAVCDANTPGVTQKPNLWLLNL